MRHRALSIVSNSEPKLDDHKFKDDHVLETFLEQWMITQHAYFYQQQTTQNRQEL